jgi:uncharacterized membrane protein YeaQ/YmgE (transglycosylase-associated protein family)
MDIERLVVTLVVGAVAGWISSLIMKRGLGLVGVIVVGVIGAFIGAYLFNLFDLRVGSGIAAAIVSATAGSVVLLFVLGLIKK